MISGKVNRNNFVKMPPMINLISHDFFQQFSVLVAQYGKLIVQTYEFSYLIN